MGSTVISRANLPELLYRRMLIELLTHGRKLHQLELVAGTSKTASLFYNGPKVWHHRTGRYYYVQQVLTGIAYATATEPNSLHRLDSLCLVLTGDNLTGLTDKALEGLGQGCMMGKDGLLR